MTVTGFRVRLLAVILASITILGLMLPGVRAADSAAVLQFTSEGIQETAAGSGYTLDGTALTITAPGTYTISGSCDEGSILVKKGVQGVVLDLRELQLSSSETAPLVCGKSSAVTIQVSGNVTLTDLENPENETSADAEIADAFEGAAIKVKSGGTLKICGSGNLTTDCASCKNGIKGGAEAAITVDMTGSLTVRAANNALASDGEVNIVAGTLDITAGNEGIKAEPDADDSVSLGAVTVYGGEIRIEAESDGIQAAGAVTIYDGQFDIHAQSDGIQTAGTLTISGGSFDIEALTGYQSRNFDSDTMSCKGLKASGDTEDGAYRILITGGDFTLNTADDAIHSDDTIEIYGGTFSIYTGDDGVHADTSLTLGLDGGLARDPDITVSASYEGLESGNLYIAGGRYNICATDDGINAAGGSSSGTDPGMGGDRFRPGGNPGMGFGGNMGGNMGGVAATGDYSLNISGGQVYVNCQGDGLDSNGAINLTGGSIEVWSQSSGDNEPLDFDGSLYVKGATVLAAGSAGMGQARPATGSQSYQNLSSRISAGALVQVKSGGNVVYQAQAPKAASYVFFSSPSYSSVSLSAGSGSVSCKTGNSWTHSWDSGTVTQAATEERTGILTYTCTVCGAEEARTIPQAVRYEAEEIPEETASDTGFAVSLTTDDHCRVAVYASQDVTGEPALSVPVSGTGETVSRSGSTGLPDSTGDGQVNFTVTIDSGYEIASVSATEGTYKNIKLISEDADAGLYVYRVTKISGDTAISVTTRAVDTGDSPFADVRSDAYYYDAVIWAAGADPVITAGTTETTFSPEAGCTRAQVVTFLWRAAGKPAPAITDCAFTDVAADAYYFSAVLWALEQGITSGTSETTFSPSETCTRAQVVSFLYRYAGRPETASTDCAFTDADSTAYYYPAMLWAVENGITYGTDETTFSPSETCTRAQVVSFLYRLIG